MLRRGVGSLVRFSFFVVLCFVCCMCFLFLVLGGVVLPCTTKQDTSILSDGRHLEPCSQLRHLLNLARVISCKALRVKRVRDELFACVVVSFLSWGIGAGAVVSFTFGGIGAGCSLFFVCFLLFP